MNRLLPVLFTASLLIAGCGKKEEPKVNINVPGVNIKLTGDGASVDAPGASIKTDKSRAEVKSPAGSIKVNQ